MISIMGVDSCRFMESDNLKGAIRAEGTCHVFWPGMLIGIPTINMSPQGIGFRDEPERKEIGFL